MLMDNAAKKFIIQEHTTPNGVHWDLMLEMEDALWTWRLNTPPADIENEPISAERIHDHPLRFLTYEGPVQNKTGHVKIADKGIYSLTKRLENSLLIDMQGKILKGEFTLCKPKDSPLWQLQSGS
jgi:hypothetical protein